MENNNIHIVKECVEQVSNRKQIDRIYDFHSKDCIFHTPPYVGLGIMHDDTSGERVEIKLVAANAPATGKVQVGDIVLRASDAYGMWEGFERLRDGSWGLGVLGTEVTLTLLRHGEMIDVTLQRGRVEGFDNILSDVIDGWQHYLTHDVPDLHSEINLILGSGDLVAYFATNTGTSAIYHQSAVWTECNILRLENGKIVEWWGVEDTLRMQHQFGFHLVEPAVGAD
jgi:predicted ester cyclase